MRIALAIANGPLAGKRVWLRESMSVRVGRTERADFVVADDARLSSLHFTLALDSGVCRLRDEHSANGTSVNGQRVQQATLGDGDRILAGTTEFTVHIEHVERHSRPVFVAPPPPLPAPPPAPLSRPPSQPRPTKPPPRPTGYPFDLGLKDEDAHVRKAALWAAIAARQPWVLDHARACAKSATAQDWEPCLALAILGRASELELVKSLASAEALGPRRWTLLGILGHPACMEPILAALGSPDPLTAVAAAEAFMRMTGVAVDSDKRVTVESAGEPPPDDFSREFLPEVILPDQAKASAWWNKEAARFNDGSRWACGVNLDQALDASILARLSLPARIEALWRAHYWDDGPGGLFAWEKIGDRA